MADFVPYTGEVVPAKSDFEPYRGDVKPPERSWSQAGGEALKSAPHSAVETAKGLVQPILHPIETAKALGEAAGGFISKTGRPGNLLREGDPEPTAEEIKRRSVDERAIDALGKFYADRWGSESAIKNTLATDPLGMAMDLSVALGGIESAAGRLPGVLKAAKIADPVAMTTGAAKTGAKVAEGVASHTLGYGTGGGPDAIRQAVKAGYENETKFIKALDGELSMEDTVKAAGKAVGNMRQERNKQYQALMKTVKADPTELDFSKIQAARKAVEDIGVYEGVPLYDKTSQVHTEVKGLLDTWEKLPKDKFHTPAGLDALKKKLGNMLDNIGFDRRADRKYVGDIKRAVSEEINGQAPVYAKIMKDYSEASDGLEEIERALSLGDRATYDTGIRKLLSAMRNNANSNYGNRLKMVDKLEEHGAKGLKSQLAGSQLSSAMPRGLAGRNPALTALSALVGGEPGILGALPFESPKLVGKSAYALGQGSREVRDLLKSTIVPDESVTKHLPSGGNVARLLHLVEQGQNNEAP